MFEPASHITVNGLATMQYYPRARTPKRMRWYSNIFADCLPGIEYWASIDDVDFPGKIDYKTTDAKVLEYVPQYEFYIISNDPEDGWGIGADLPHPNGKERVKAAALKKYPELHEKLKGVEEQTAVNVMVGMLSGAEQRAATVLTDMSTVRIDIDLIELGLARYWQLCMGSRDRLGKPLNNSVATPPEPRNPSPATSYGWQLVIADITDGEDGDYDASVLDSVIQLAVFNEIIYG